VSGPGFIDHIGFGVPDLAAAKEYYDDLMAVLGFREWFATVPGDPFNYGPDDARGGNCSSTRQEPRSYSRRETGLHHDAFLVSSRAVVREAHRWACARDAVILDEPGEEVVP
jgi:catechol 2,3-dioxygenase-like lactoylglutathione lyase family enzyme